MYSSAVSKWGTPHLGLSSTAQIWASLNRGSSQIPPMTCRIITLEQEVRFCSSQDSRKLGHKIMDWWECPPNILQVVCSVPKEASKVYWLMGWLRWNASKRLVIPHSWSTGDPWERSRMITGINRVSKEIPSPHNSREKLNPHWGCIRTNLGCLGQL